MRWSKIATFFLFSPFILSILLWWIEFQINTSETLTLFVSLVWGILIALSGGFYFISNFDFSKQKKRKQFMKTVSDRIQGIALAIFIHTILFVFLAFLYPIRYFLGRYISLTSNLKTVYDSLLFVEIIIPSLASIFIGIWCVLLILNNESND